MLNLPAELIGKTITVVEKTPSVTFADQIVPAAGVTVSVTGNYGYVGFKVKQRLLINARQDAPYIL